MARRTVLPAPCVRAYLDAGVTWYPANAAAAAARRERAERDAQRAVEKARGAR